MNINQDPGLKFHTQLEVCIRFMKNTNLPNSEVSKIMSIGMRVPMHRMLTSDQC